MTFFLAVSFVILPQHYAMKKKEERLPFLLSSFLIFLFQFAFYKEQLGRLPRLRAAPTWRKRRDKRCEGEWGCCGALIVAPHEPIHKVQLHTRRRTEHPTPKEEGGRCFLRCYCLRCCCLLCLFRLRILLLLLRRGRLIES